MTRLCSERDSLRVVMPIYYFFPVMGGAEQQASRLAGELIRMGHDVSIITGRWQREWAADEHLAGVPVRRISTLWPWLDRVKGFFFRHLAFEIGLAWYLFRNRHRYDVIHVHQALHAAFVTSLAAPLARKPVLVKIGCGGVNSDIRIMRENIVNPFSSWFWRVIRRCDRFIAISHEIEQELLADGVDPDRITRLPNGISVEGYEPKAAYDNSSPLRLVSVGRLDPQKGYDVLLDALSRFDLPEFEFRVYGEGRDREMLQGLIRSHGLEGRVFLEGVVHDLPQRLSGSDLFVLVSRAEGLSNALMEAMLCGLPCVVTAVGGNTDLVAPEDVEVKVDAGGYRIMSNGIVVNSDDPEGTVKALELLARDRELAARLGRAAAAWMRRNNALGQVAERYVGIYRELLHRKDGRPAP